MTFAKKGTYGVPEFAGTEVNRRSGNLKGLTGNLHKHFTNYGQPASPRHDGRSTNNHMKVNISGQVNHVMHENKTLVLTKYSGNISLHR